MNQTTFESTHMHNVQHPDVSFADEYGKTIGGRLKIARLLTGYLQKTIVQADGFPAISVVILQEWENVGIPEAALEQVAVFFHVKAEIFNPELTSDETFWDLISQIDHSAPLQ